MENIDSKPIDFINNLPKYIQALVRKYGSNKVVVLGQTGIGRSYSSEILKITNTENVSYEEALFILKSREENSKQI